MQSPSDTPATGWPGAASACSKVTVVPSSAAKRSAQASGVVDQRADERVLRGRRQRRAGSGCRPGAAEAGVDRELEGAPLEEDAAGVAGVAEAHLGQGPRRDVHLLLLQVRHRRLEVLDLQGDGVHAAPEARDELGRRALDDRLADLDRVVAGPRHAAAPPDARLGRLAVLEHREADQGAEVPDGQVVVGHHRGGVEQPADVVSPPCVGPAHRPAVTGQLDAGDVARARAGEEDDRLGHVGRVDVAPQRCAGGHAGGHVVGALSGAGGDGLDHGTERLARRRSRASPR